MFQYMYYLRIGMFPLRLCDRYTFYKKKKSCKILKYSRKILALQSFFNVQKITLNLRVQSETCFCNSKALRHFHVNKECYVGC